MSAEQSKFEGWAIVEMMGHRREIGYVTTENYGAAALFRVDTPGLEEREYMLERPEWIRTDKGVTREAPIGSKVRRPGVPSRSVLVGPGSVYALNPCTEEAAKLAIERGISRPLVLLSVPEGKRLLAAEDVHDDNDPSIDEEDQEY